MPTILIELPGGEGVVRRDDGEIVITRDVRDWRGAPLEGGDYRPAKDWLDELGAGPDAVSHTRRLSGRSGCAAAGCVELHESE